MAKTFTRAISNAIAFNLPPITQREKKKKEKNLVIASRLFGKFAISSPWKRTKLTGKEKRESERESERERRRRKEGNVKKMPSIPSNAIRITTV